MAPGLSAGQGFGPVCNRGVEALLVARRRDRHRRILAGSRARVDNGWSQNEVRRLQASRSNVKRHQAEDERLGDINKENGRLVMKMHEIDQRREPVSTAGQAAAQLVLGGALLSARTSSVPAGSNARGRAHEFARIDDENQKLLRRLHGTKPTVDVKAMEDHHQGLQKVMRMRCELQPEPLQLHRLEAMATKFSPRSPPSASPTGEGAPQSARRPVLEEAFGGAPARDLVDELFAQRRCLQADSERDAEIAAAAARVILAKAVDQGDGQLGYAALVQRERPGLEAIGQ